MKLGFGRSGLGAPGLAESAHSDQTNGSSRTPEQQSINPHPKNNAVETIIDDCKFRSLEGALKIPAKYLSMFGSFLFSR